MNESYGIHFALAMSLAMSEKTFAQRFTKRTFETMQRDRVRRDAVVAKVVNELDHNHAGLGTYANVTIDEADAEHFARLDWHRALGFKEDHVTFVDEERYDPQFQIKASVSADRSARHVLTVAVTRTSDRRQ